MTTLSAYQQYGEELERRLRLRSFPLAWKMLEKEADIPQGAKRPKRDWGFHIAACQGFQMSRREGTIVAMLKEDMWCAEATIGYGLGEPPDYFLQGHNRYPDDVATLEAGRIYALEYPRLQAGKYIGIASAPLKATNFEPDLVVVYCDSPQLNLLLLAREYKDGHNLNCHLSSHAACVYATVPALQSGNCQVAVPCRGDRYAAGAGDDEMIFAVPEGKLEDLMAGLRYVEKSGSRLPRAFRMQYEYPLRESYKKIARMMGTDIK